MPRRALLLLLLACGACNKDNPLFGLERPGPGEPDTGELSRTSGDATSVTQPDTSTSGGAGETATATSDPVDTSGPVDATGPVDTTEATTGPAGTCPMGQASLEIGYAEEIDGVFVAKDIGDCGVGLIGPNGKPFRVKKLEGRTLELEACQTCDDCGGGSDYALTLDFPGAEAHLAPLADTCLSIVLAPGHVIDPALNLCGFASAFLRVLDGAPEGAPVPTLLAHRSGQLDATFDYFGFHVRHDASEPLPGCEDAPACAELGPAAPRRAALTAWTDEAPEPQPLADLAPGETVAGAAFAGPAATYATTVQLVRAAVDAGCERAAVEWVVAFDPQ